MNKKFYVFFLFSFFLFSCSHTKDPIILENPGLIQTFEINDQEMNKFIEESEIEKVPDQNEGKKKNPQHGQKKGETSAAKKSEPPKKGTKENKDSLVTNGPVSYPEDYPKHFLEWGPIYAQTWEDFSPALQDGEEVTVNIKYLGLIVGEVKMTTGLEKKVGETPAVRFRGVLKSSDYYAYIYRLEDVVESFVDPKTFLPIKYTVTQRETRQSVDDLQLFDHNQHKTFHWYKRIKKDSNRNEKKVDYIPEKVLDSFTPLFFIRYLPLKMNYKFQIPVVTRGETWMLTGTVVSEEWLTVMNGKFKTKAWKIAVDTNFPGVLKKRGEAIFWFSQEHNHLPLKFEAKVKIGTVSGEIIKWNLSD
jgi:hypothetical protein